MLTISQTSFLYEIYLSLCGIHSYSVALKTQANNENGMDQFSIFVGKLQKA